MQAHPHAKRSQGLAELGHPGTHGPAVNKISSILNINTIGTGVLRNNKKLFYSRLHKALGLAHHLTDRPRHQIAAHTRDNAEATTMVAAL